MRECANMVLLIGFVMGTVYLSALKYTVPITPVKKRAGFRRLFSLYLAGMHVAASHNSWFLILFHKFLLGCVFIMGRLLK